MVHFLVDASLPRATAELIRSLGHQATDVRDIGFTSATDRDIAAYANSNQLGLITRDQDFGNVLDYPPQDYFGIVVIHAPENANRSVVLKMIEGFLNEPPLVERIKGHLAIVDVHKIRMRPES